jgi:hypothetical protein
MESVLLRLPIRKTDMCCMDGGGSWVDRSGSYKAISLSPLTGHGAAQHEFFLATLTIFVLFPLGYDTFLPRRARLRPLRPVCVMEWPMMRDGLPPVCVTFWHSLAALHLSSAFRVAHRAPRASRSRSVRRPAKPHGRPYNAPSAGGGEYTVYCTGTQCLCWPGAAEPSLRRRCVLTN